MGAPLPAAERGDVDRITAAGRAVPEGAAFTAEFEHGTRLAADGAVLRACAALDWPPEYASSGTRACRTPQGAA
ncbi:hypothetical protein ABZY02_32380 [Streptomyces sp. NPDC006649]|uniref:hypothetical protein n=1 Tax=Streptomyces sp. NPDC006649 TaxID=3156896 RepID=UPI0033BDB2AB